MRKTAELPLHTGKAPAWLFRRMVEMAGAIGTLIVRDAGPQELLARLSDPFWFQAFGCVLGFDWHSSGVTTTVCGALKEAAKKYGADLGLIVCGGKGATSRKTPDDIRRACERTGDPGERLVYASRTSAKVDSAAVQDGYQLYHHVFFFTSQGDWSVVQQGMCYSNRMARRYHWLSDRVASFVDEPHEAVCCDARAEATLNLVAHDNDPVRRASAELASQPPDITLRALTMPRRHMLFPEMDVARSRLERILVKTYERAPADFESLIAIEGVGAKTLRALALASELVHGTAASFGDPARFSFAHGGKDGIPYPVAR